MFLILCFVIYALTTLVAASVGTVFDNAVFVIALLAALPGDTARDTYRIVFTGERGCPLELSELERELSPDFYGLSLRDKTRPARELWARMGEDTLTGLFLQEMSRRCAQTPDDDALALAVRFGLAALEGGEDVSL